MGRACIVGWAHTPFGKLDDPDVESLIARSLPAKHSSMRGLERKRSTAFMSG